MNNDTELREKIAVKLCQKVELPFTYHTKAMDKIIDFILSPDCLELLKEKYEPTPDLREACKSALNEWTLHGALTDTARELKQALTTPNIIRRKNNVIRTYDKFNSCICMCLF